jgi:hypothetical protein
MADNPSPNFVQEYWTGAWQRWILTLDVLVSAAIPTSNIVA